ncbi:MAG: peptidoglycan DD-metalloendopeptidase family protein [Dictyoglomaceae bacterium]|nr:peptidoglycan DD-metalloendopeptidase family protein [Dictyoglomaceae bacterium]
MRNKRITSFIFIFVLFFSIFIEIGESVDLLTKKKQELQQKKQRINILKEQVKILEGREMNIAKEIGMIDQQLEKTERELVNAEAKLGQAQANLIVISTQLKIMERNLKNRSLNYKVALGEILKENSNNRNFWEIFLGNKSSFDFLAVPYYLKNIFKNEAQKLNKIDNQCKDLAQKRKEWEEEKKRIESLVKEIEEKKAYIERKKREKNAYLEEIRKKKRLQQQTIATLERESKEIEALIRKLASASQIRKAKKGRLSWPVIGAITSSFGIRRHPLLGGAYMMHTGIDISADYGTPVRAVAPGKVIYADWYGGYGKLVILDHGGGVATLYAHLSRIVVELEEQISEGQVVGYVGSTGLSTGFHLHFEVRVNGSPQDPLPWLK